MVFNSSSEAVTENSSLLPRCDPPQESPYPLSSEKKTFGNIVISVVGAGVLGLPYTFKRTGWLTGSSVLLLTGYLCFYCMMLLVNTRRHLDALGRVGIATLSDLGFHVYGQIGRALVDSMVILSQGGFCIGYLIFIGENLASILANFDDYSPSKDPVDVYAGIGIDQPISSNYGSSFLGLDWASKATYVWLLFPLQVGLSVIRYLTHLAPFSIFADLANALAMAVVMKDDILAIKGGIRHVTASTAASNIPFAVGVAIYAFEGIPLVLPLESAMKEKVKFGNVIGYAMSSIAFLYVVFGLLGYLAFGNETKDIVTLNLVKSWETVIIQLGLCVGLFFTYPVMMHPVHEVFERRFSTGKPSYIVRTLMVLLTVFIAAAVPRFSDFMSLVGSSVCSILVFILPALFHLQVLKKDVSPLTKAADYFLIAFGVVFGIWGTITSVMSIS